MNREDAVLKNSIVEEVNHAIGFFSMRLGAHYEEKVEAWRELLDLHDTLDALALTYIPEFLERRKRHDDYQANISYSEGALDKEAYKKELLRCYYLDESMADAIIAINTSFITLEQYVNDGATLTPAEHVHGRESAKPVLVGEGLRPYGAFSFAVNHIPRSERPDLHITDRISIVIDWSGTDLQELVKEYAERDIPAYVVNGLPLPRVTPYNEKELGAQLFSTYVALRRELYKLKQAYTPPN